MKKGELELRLSLGKLLIGLIIALVPISLLSFYTILKADQALDQSVGSNFHTIAQSNASQVSSYIHSRVLEVAMLAQMPPVVDAVIAANRAYPGMSDAAFQSKVENTEKIWNTSQADPMVQTILTSAAARALQKQLPLDRRFLRITLTDQRGAVIAATHKTLDYYQADEDFWQAIYASGRGAVNLTDILYDEVTKSNYIGIGVPVVEEGSGRFLGALDALIEVSGILPAAGVQPTATSKRTILVKDDGTIINAPGVTLAMNLKSDEYRAVADLLKTEQGRLKGYAQADVGGADKMIGFADTGLRGDYKNLGWIVLVVQDAGEAFAPMRGALQLIWIMALASLAALALLAAYFSVNRRQEYEDLAEAEKHLPREPATNEGYR